MKFLSTHSLKADNTQMLLGPGTLLQVGSECSLSLCSGHTFRVGIERMHQISDVHRGILPDLDDSLDGTPRSRYSPEASVTDMAPGITECFLPGPSAAPMTNLDHSFPSMIL